MKHRYEHQLVWNIISFYSIFCLIGLNRFFFLLLFRSLCTLVLYTFVLGFSCERMQMFRILVIYKFLLPYFWISFCSHWSLHRPKPPEWYETKIRTTKAMTAEHWTLNIIEFLKDLRYSNLVDGAMKIQLNEDYFHLCECILVHYYYYRCFYSMKIFFFGW